MIPDPVMVPDLRALALFRIHFSLSLSLSLSFSPFSCFSPVAKSDDANRGLDVWSDVWWLLRSVRSFPQPSLARFLHEDLSARAEFSHLPLESDAGRVYRRRCRPAMSLVASDESMTGPGAGGTENKDAGRGRRKVIPGRNWRRAIYVEDRHNRKWSNPT